MTDEMAFRCFSNCPFRSKATEAQAIAQRFRELRSKRSPGAEGPRRTAQSRPYYLSWLGHGCSDREGRLEAVASLNRELAPGPGTPSIHSDRVPWKPSRTTANVQSR